MEKHNINPIYNKNSSILILGSFPSVKSREQAFYYAHPQNRFWKIISKILNENYPQTTEEKIKILLSNRIALWDVVKQCEIEGSQDSKIKNIEYNDIQSIVDYCKIKAIFCNGSTSYNLLKKSKIDLNSIPIYKLESTSPANARQNEKSLLENWKIIVDFIS